MTPTALILLAISCLLLGVGSVRRRLGERRALRPGMCACGDHACFHTSLGRCQVKDCKCQQLILPGWVPESRALEAGQ